VSKREPLVDRFWRKVDCRGPNECWPWIGRAMTRRYLGYGQIGNRRRELNGERLSHRIAWTLAFGAIPAGRLVLHSCNVSICCNAQHMYLGDQADNGRDKKRAGRARGTPGERNPHARLTEDFVRLLRQAQPTPLVRRAIAESLGVTYDTIYSAAVGKTWKHV